VARPAGGDDPGPLDGDRHQAALASRTR
jgi:hypothetical protein